MKKTILMALAICTTTLILAQSTKSYTLEVVAEGNFGTPNGDVYRVTSNGTNTVQAGPLFAQANSTVGIDVLQDYETFGNRAILISKGGGSQKIVIASYPGFVQQQIITGFSPQSIVKVSNTTAYIGGAATSAVRKVDLVSGAITAINDPSGYITGSVSNMVYANGNVYVAYSNKLVKIDTVSSTTTASFTLGITSVSDILYDQTQQRIWTLGKLSGTSALVKVEVNNNDFVNIPNTLTGFTNAAWLRQYHDSLFFLSSKKVYAVNKQSVVSNTVALYTSTLTGSWDFAYGKAFYVDPNSGDFVIGSANAFTGPSLYEIVDGHTFQQMAMGNVAGKGVNEFILKTQPNDNTPPVPNVTSLANAIGQCSVSLTPPTATDNVAGVITGTTSASLNYTAQGTFTVNWTYNDGNGNTASQTQTVIVNDNTAPVPNVASLATVTLQCMAAVQSPAATDNCTGIITGTTTAALSYSTTGTRVITWNYNDGHGNSASQTQTVVVNCASTGIATLENQGMHISMYPNPANEICYIQLNNKTANAVTTIEVTDAIGRVVMSLQTQEETISIPTAPLNNGLYYVSVLDANHLKTVPVKLVITH